MTRDIYAPLSVVEPVGRAIEEVKKILFSPFNLEKWFTIGFCAWLAFLGSSGGSPGGGGGGGSGGHNTQSANQEIEAVFQQAKEWVVANLAWLIPVVCGVITIIVLISFVLCWLSSRGRFMFLHCVAQNKAEVSIPWTRYAQQGNSLFLFRICFGLIAFILVLLYIAAVGLSVFSIWKSGQGSQEVNISMILAIIAGVLGLILLSIVLGIVHKFTLDFVVPIMYLRMTTCLAAWREFLEIVSARKGALFVYLLFQFVIQIGIGAITFALVLVTCLCACCLMMIPYIGTVVLLPILVFRQAYTLHYLRQFGSDFDVFLPDPQTEPIPVIVM